MRAITFHVSEGVYQELLAIARRSDRTTAELMREAMEAYLDTQTKSAGRSNLVPISGGVAKRSR